MDRIELPQNWEFRQDGQEQWYRASVPGCVHTDLMANGLIPDPFYRDNETRLQWIGETNLVYRTQFNIEERALTHEVIDMVFEGLDTYATVFLNEQEILSADNMFRTWRVEVRDVLVAGPNTLRIEFRSPINEIRPLLAKKPFTLPADNDPGKTSPYTRKAPYHFGWDWGPRLVTCGVWRPVYMECWDAARIDRIYFIQQSMDEKRASIRAQLEILASRDTEAAIHISNEENAFPSIARSFSLKRGVNFVHIDVIIHHPRLWWPNGMGEQALYTMQAELSVRGRSASRISARIGLRTIELRRQPDQWGESFEFVINGVSMFARGGNWIPADSFPSRVRRDRYYHLLTSCKAANMNMLRVWGGGIYEDDTFYDLCDELGLLVWQDFMFSCSLYPGDDEFIENVRQEATDQIKRLRNHPSLALWCGNNEIEAAWLDWGWKEKLPERVWQDYRRLFHDLLPKTCARLDPSRPYWPSSPSSELRASSQAQEIGDMHYWGVWHGGEPFENYMRQTPRFMSEYGFQSFPEQKTIDSFALAEDRDIESPVMTIHQKHPRGNQLIRQYMQRYYPEPKDFEAFLYLSQVVQAEGIKTGAEHLRRIRPQCMGSLYWQIDDCWPVASWSSIDYFGRWKALHYYARRFYADVLVSPVAGQEHINVYIVSDLPNPISGILGTRLITFDGTVLWQQSTPIVIEPQSSRIYASIRQASLFKGAAKESVALTCELQSQEVTAQNTLLFKFIKYLSLPRPHITPHIRKAEVGFSIRLKTDCLAKDVHLATTLDGFFDDNYFDMLPGAEKIVHFNTQERMQPTQFTRELKIISIVDAFKG